ncbi:hypothetical protein L1887_38408 [Cichorium endivia]|nr:hypothetical protein L1887_38408 [Cichorium endivia]
MEGKWWEVESILKNDKNAVGEVINTDGETLLHIAVGTGHKNFIRNLLEFIKDKEILKRRSLDGSTALHIAAITGNKYAAGLLIEKEKSLIDIRNREGTLPYVVAYFNNHFDTSVFLFKSTNPKKGQGLRRDLTDRNLLLDVISTRQYDLALQLFKAYNEDLAVKDDAEVLMTLARNFPTGLSYWEKLIYPSLSDIQRRICSFSDNGNFGLSVDTLSHMDSLFSISYALFLLVEYRNNSCAAHKAYRNEKEGMGKSKRGFKIACQNAYEVVVEILSRSPKAIRWTDKSGYNIIHLAVIHRSEKVYNLIHDIVVRKILSKSRIDVYNNNVLHLVGKLAPPSKLKIRTGAVLQLQRELQWREVHSK